MKVLILLGLAVGALAAAPGKRIIGGINANAGEFPFAAALYTSTDSGTYFCAGVLISNEFVLTAASCTAGVRLFQIRLGTTALDATGSNVLRLSADKYIPHPDFNPITLENDISLVQFRVPIGLTDYIQPIGFPVRDVQSYAVVSAIGWGQISDNQAGLANNLQIVTLTALSNEECRLSFGSQIYDSMVCVDGNYNEGTCNGDNGGPLIQYVNGRQATVVGIAAFISQNGCESTDPSGFTRVFPYLDWIREATGIP